MPAAVFIFAFGACVGSFINVVVYRLPAGMSVITPPSRCPTCGWRLTWWENLPILGWFIVRGRCRRCGIAISPQYMIVELLMALVFLGLYVALYAVPPHIAWWGEIGGPWWYSNGLLRLRPGLVTTAPMFIALSFLMAGLIGMTLIDARTFTIPIQIPLVVTIIAFAAAAIQAVVPLRTPPPAQPWPVPLAGWPWAMTAAGGMLGIVIGNLLLRAGRLRYSFADYHEYVKEGEALGDYPHARREMLLELAFLAPCVAGLAAGWLLGRVLPEEPPPVLIGALGASAGGYLVGAGLIWVIRILGTLGFGREAMGLGDVHLLGAVGAVLGPCDPIWIFFLAPFSGLLWVAASAVFSSMLHRARRELPYGPHLAVATFIVVACRPGIDRLQAALFPFWTC